MLLHLGAFSSHILPDLFRILDEKASRSSRSKKRRKIRPTTTIRTSPTCVAGRTSSWACRRKKIPWPANAPQLPRERLTTICN
jgi:hypothetical protein